MAQSPATTTQDKKRFCIDLLKKKLNCYPMFFRFLGIEEWRIDWFRYDRSPVVVKIEELFDEWWTTMSSSTTALAKLVEALHRIQRRDMIYDIVQAGFWKASDVPPIAGGYRNELVDASHVPPIAGYRNELVVDTPPPCFTFQIGSVSFVGGEGSSMTIRNDEGTLVITSSNGIQTIYH